MTPLALAEMPRWPRPVPALMAWSAGWLTFVVTAWERSTYPARLEQWRRYYQPQAFKDCETQRYVQRPPVCDVAGFRRALQGVE